MFDFKDAANIGKSYKGFTLLSIDDLPDYKTQAVFLRHKRTGLEVYHILKEDKENLFAFAFRTLAKDSKGAAHIMEHSVLCGSEKYPLKEPFNTLASTCLSTFLNALTYPDKTVYPGASVVRDDYFNMMDVYADAVFFPKLDYSTFIQEGHRLELDENEKMSIQGVVYNEMKGNYSNFQQIAFSEVVRNMFPESYPAFDSGGDPLNIPSLTYEEFLDFHQKFYNPDNCILFLYGDIPTETQLDFLDEHFMSRIEKKYNCTKDVENGDSKLPLIKPEILELQKLNFIDESKTIKSIAPETGSTGNFVCINWYSGLNDMEKYYLSQVLSGNDSSPLDHALKESELGDEVSTGNFGQYSQEFFTAGMWGVKKGNEEKVFKLIKKTLKEVYEKGVSQKDIDSAVMGIDFNLREENRYFGPYSIQIMEKVLKGWVRGDACGSQLTPISSFEKVKEKIRTDKDYTKNLIKKYFIDPEVEVRFVIEPSSEYFEKRNAAEAELIEKLGKTVDKEKLKKDLETLHAYQQHVETSEETSCIPSTKLSSLDPKVEYGETELQFVTGYDGNKVPLFISKEETNGIFYLDVLFPFDNLDTKYFKHMSLLDFVLTNMGWNGKKWDECIAQAACIAGDVWGSVYYGGISDAPECLAFAEKYKEYNFCGRQWIGLGCKALTSMADETLKLLTEITTTMSFDDKKRLNSLIQDLKADKKTSIVSAGRDYTVKRASALWNENNALQEILWGISQLETLEGYTKKNLNQTLEALKYIYYESQKSGGIIHITADDESLKKILPMLEDFAKNTKITKLLPGKKRTVEDYKPYIAQSEDINTSDIQLLKVDTQTGYAAVVTPASKYLTKESAAELIFTEWMSNHTLWDKIRTTGGAYGGRAYIDNVESKITFFSYRDPTPGKSVNVYLDSLKDLCNKNIASEEIEKTIVCCYGDAIVPVSPKDRGHNTFDGMLYANPQSLRLLKVEKLLSVTQKDVVEASERLYEAAKENCYKAVFCDKKDNTVGKIIHIPL